MDNQPAPSQQRERLGPGYATPDPVLAGQFLLAVKKWMEERDAQRVNQSQVVLRA